MVAKTERKFLIGSIALVVGFVLLILGIAVGGIHQGNQNYVATFQNTEGVFTLQRELSVKGGPYYLVANINGERRQHRILYAYLEISGEETNKVVKLRSEDSFSTECSFNGSCWTQILSKFEVESDTKYQLTLNGFDMVGSVNIITLNLHTYSYESKLAQAVTVLMGIFCLIMGLLLIVFSYIQRAYNKLLQRIP